MDTAKDDRLDTRIEALLEHAEWARKLAGRLVVDAARADDVVQIALAAAAKNPPADSTNLRGWLGSVVRNAARTIGREETRRAQRERRAAKPEALEGVDELVARAEMSRELAQHVLALDEIYRDVVLLRWYEGLAPREIARKLDVPVATVNTRLSRAHEALRARLDQSHGDRTQWCLAFAPLAEFPRAEVPVTVSVAALCLLLAVGTLTVVTLNARRGDHGETQRMARAESTDATTRATPLATANESGRPNAIEPVDRVPLRTTLPSSTENVIASELASTHFEGHVVDFAGRPVAGVELIGRDLDLPRIERGWLRVGNSGLQIRDGDQRAWKEDPRNLELMLAHFGHAPGLREVLLGGDLSATTQTDSHGAFVLDAPGSQAQLEIRDAQFALVATGKSPTWTGEVLLVAPAVRVSGTIVDEKGVPVAKARVSPSESLAAIAALPFEFEARGYDSTSEVPSDANGHFDLGRIARWPNARIQVAIETEYVADIEVPAQDSSNVVIVAKAPTLPAKKPRVSGHVLDAQGRGIAHAEVRLEGRGAATDLDGRFDLEADYFSAESEIVAVKQGLSPGWIVDFGRELRAKGTLDDVVIRIAGAALSITGEARDAEGHELSGWLVTLADTIRYPGMGIPLEFAAVGLYGTKQQPKTDGAGRFSLGGLAPQKYRVRLIDPRTGVVYDSEPIEAGARDVSIHVPADAWRSVVHGRTISTLGAPVASVRIAVLYPMSEGRGFSRYGHAETTTSDASGAFELRNVTRRSLRLSVSGKNVQEVSIAVSDDANPNDIVLTITLTHRFRVEVASTEHIDGFEILDRAGKVLHVEAQRTTATSTNSRTSLDGERFPICTVSEEGTTIVLYSHDREVRRAVITWSGERIQTVRP